MNVKYNYLFLNLLLIFASVICRNERSPYVKTALGGITGYYKKSAEGRQFAAFESIRYAKPPIGKLRFEPPVPIDPWSEDIQALSLPPSCSQYQPATDKVIGVEDCLYLNIYTPAKSDADSLPVIFWIHGGGFQMGDVSKYGPKYLMDRDVILVSINYRIGPLGFLSTGDEVVPGNMGLKDQSLALKFISENIQYFGGDPKRITLMGVSAGSACVHYHYLSPLSAGLFHNGISFSGTALNHWSFTPDTLKSAKDLAAALKCPTNRSLAMVQCFKKVPSQKFVAAANGLKVDFNHNVFPPVVEKTNANYFINDTPINIIVNGRANDVPWITGLVKDEGLLVSAEYALSEKKLEHLDKNWEIISPYIYNLQSIVPENQFAGIVNKAKKYYFGNKSFSKDKGAIRNLTHLIGDGMFARGAIQAAKLQARYNKSPVRFYYYTYRAAQSLTDQLTNSTIDFGVCHDDDIYLVFDNPVINPTTTANDRAMLQDMLRYWYSFVSTGEPDLNTEWPGLKEPSDKLHYMHIAGPKDFTMQLTDNLQEELFWKQLGI